MARQPDDAAAMDDVALENGWQNGRSRNDSSAPEYSSSSFDVEGGLTLKDREPTTAQHAGLLAEDLNRAVWTNRARWFTGVAMILDFVTAVLALVAGGIIDSAALVGYGLEAFVDMGASCLVLWRFWHDAESEAGMRANLDREERANVVIAFIFIAIAIITTGTAISHLVERRYPEEGFLIIAFAVVTFLLLGACGAVKLYINKHVGSKALEQDAMASFATSAISLGLIVSAATYEANHKIWWLDAAIAIVVTCSLAIYSIPVLVKRRWWHKSFWRAWTGDS